MIEKTSVVKKEWPVSRMEQVTIDQAEQVLSELRDELATIADLSGLTPVNFTPLYKEGDTPLVLIPSVAERISKLVNCDDERIRTEVVQALCSYCQVPGYEWVAQAAWKRASDVRLHYVAGGIISTITRRDQVTVQLAYDTCAYLFRSSPSRGDFGADELGELEFQEALAADAIFRRESWRVAFHLVRIIEGASTELDMIDSFPGCLWDTEVVNWESVARLFHAVLTPIK